MSFWLGDSTVSPANVRQLVQALDEFHSLGVDFIWHQEALHTSTPMGRARFAIIAAMGQLDQNVYGQTSPEEAEIDYGSPSELGYALTLGRAAQGSFR